MSNWVPPFENGYINIYDSVTNPSEMTVTNTRTSAFFRRYLTQKAMAATKWILPDWWNRDYFLYSLYIGGHIAVVDGGKYGVICQYGAPNGYNVMYRPTNYQYANPLLPGERNPKIDIDCTVFKMCEDWRGIGDLVSFYADYMALISQAVGVNVANSKMALAFGAKDKATAASLKKAYDQVLDGKLAVFVDSKILSEDGRLTVQMFQQNIKQNYVANDLLQTMATIENKFLTTIGISNANTDKRERLITDEVNANNEETKSLIEFWMDGWRETIAKTEKMFPEIKGKISVELKGSVNNG